MRRPTSLEIHLPVAPVGRYLNHLVTWAAVAVLMSALLSWASVRDTLAPWAHHVLMVLLVVAPASLLIAATNTRLGRALRALFLPAQPRAWLLRHDGQHWHWWGLVQEGQAAGGASDEPVCGTGRVELALSIGPWWLLKARPAAGQGGTVWIWVRGAKLGVSGRRLRTLLTWST